MINCIDLQSVNSKTQYSSRTSSSATASSNFDSYLNSSVNSFSNTAEQNNEQKDSVHNEPNNHQKYINELKDAIKRYNKASSISKCNEQKSFEQDVINNNELNESKESLQNALKDVSKMVKDDKSMTKEEISEVKKLLKDIPENIKADSNIKNIVQEISQSIEKIELENSDLIVLVPSSDTKVTNTTTDSQTTEEVDSKDDSDKTSDADKTSNEALLQTLQSLLVQLQDPNNNLKLGNAESKEKLVSVVKSIIDAIGKNPQSAGKLITNFLNQNADSIAKLLQTSGLDTKEVTDILEKLQNINSSNTNTSSEIKTITNLLTKADTSTNKTEIVDSSNTTTDVAKADTSNLNQSDSKSSDGSNSSLKEEKVLKSIISGTDSNVVNRFALVSNNTTVQQNTVTANQPIINQSNMAEDVIQTIKYMSTQGVDELLVKINPRELGELVINIIRDGNAMKAEIKASSKETYALLMQNSDDLKKYLGEQNIKISQVDISLTQDSMQRNQDSFFGESHKQNSRNFGSSKDNGTSDYQEDDDIQEDDLLANINMLV